MRKSKFNEVQITAILKEAEAGVAVTKVARKHGVSAATFLPVALNVSAREHRAIPDARILEHRAPVLRLEAKRCLRKSEALGRPKF